MQLWCLKRGFLGSTAEGAAGWFLGPVVFAGPQIERLRFLVELEWEQLGIL